VALQMQGKGEQAAAILARAVAARPDGADLRFNHGAVLASLGREDEARQVLETGARKHPDNAEIKELLQLLR